MKNALIAAVVSALVASGGTYAASRPTARTLIVRGDITQVAAGQRGNTSVKCPQGTRVTGGGLISSQIAVSGKFGGEPVNQGAVITDSTPLASNKAGQGWVAAVKDIATTGFAPIQAYAVCIR